VSGSHPSTSASTSANLALSRSVTWSTSSSTERG
jgi:hypothetical protein